MPTIKYIDASGSETEVEASTGSSVMQAAVDNMIDGILAECGGACACATCHCYVDGDWADTMGKVEATEAEMLEAVSDRKPSSRLSCQITVTEEMNVLVVRLPESQF